MLENTLSIIKPDAVERNLEENIKSIFKKNALKILRSKKIRITKVNIPAEAAMAVSP